MADYTPDEDPVVTCAGCGSQDDDREVLLAWSRGAKVKCGDCGHEWMWGF